MSDSYEELFDSLKALGGSISALQQQAVQEYTPVVEQIIISRSRDEKHIEHTLDGLLDFCGHDSVLQLFKSLCRHYYDFAPQAAAEYVRFYREMWDSADKEESQ